MQRLRDALRQDDGGDGARGPRARGHPEAVRVHGVHARVLALRGEVELPRFLDQALYDLCGGAGFSARGAAFSARGAVFSARVGCDLRKRTAGGARRGARGGYGQSDRAEHTRAARDDCAAALAHRCHVAALRQGAHRGVAAEERDEECLGEEAFVGGGGVVGGSHSREPQVVAPVARHVLAGRGDVDDLRGARRWRWYAICAAYAARSGGSGRSVQVRVLTPRPGPGTFGGMARLPWGAGSRGGGVAVRGALHNGNSRRVQGCGRRERASAAPCAPCCAWPHHALRGVAACPGWPWAAQALRWSRKGAGPRGRSARGLLAGASGLLARHGVSGAAGAHAYAHLPSPRARCRRVMWRGAAFSAGRRYAPARVQRRSASLAGRVGAAAGSRARGPDGRLQPHGPSRSAGGRPASRAADCPTKAKDSCGVQRLQCLLGCNSARATTEQGLCSAARFKLPSTCRLFCASCLSWRSSRSCPSRYRSKRRARLLVRYATKRPSCCVCLRRWRSAAASVARNPAQHCQQAAATALTISQSQKARSTFITIPALRCSGAGAVRCSVRV